MTSTPLADKTYWTNWNLYTFDEDYVIKQTCQGEKHMGMIGIYIAIENFPIIMLEQIRTIDKSRLLEYIGHLDYRDMKEVDASLKISLDMGPETRWIFWDGRKRQGLVVI